MGGGCDDVAVAWQENNSILTLIFRFYFILLHNLFFSYNAKKKILCEETDAVYVVQKRIILEIYVNPIFVWNLGTRA